MEAAFINLDIIQLIIKHWKRLIFITIGSVFASYFFSGEWFIRPKFKSIAIVYPVNILPFSDETETEQLLEILYSADIRDSVVSIYNLYSHYGVDSSSKASYSQIIDRYNKNISLTKTRYDAIQVEVFDIDPVQARDMVNTIIELANEKIKRLSQEKAMEIVRVKKEQLHRIKNEMDSVEKIITALRVEDGLLHYDVQTEEVSKRYLKEIFKPGYTINQNSLKEVKQLLNNLKEKGGEFQTLNTYQGALRNYYNVVKIEYEEALKDSLKDLTYTNVVSKPGLADKKSYPVRWLIVLFSAISTLLISVVALIVLKNLHLFKKQ